MTDYFFLIHLIQNVSNDNLRRSPKPTCFPNRPITMPETPPSFSKTYYSVTATRLTATLDHVSQIEGIPSKLIPFWPSPLIPKNWNLSSVVSFVYPHIWDE